MNIILGVAIIILVIFAIYSAFKDDAHSVLIFGLCCYMIFIVNSLSEEIKSDTQEIVEKDKEWQECKIIDISDYDDGKFTILVEINNNRRAIYNYYDKYNFIQRYQINNYKQYNDKEAYLFFTNDKDSMINVQLYIDFIIDFER